jgi:hypothetical protein
MTTAIENKIISILILLRQQQIIKGRLFNVLLRNISK